MEILRSWGLAVEVRAGAANVEPRAWRTSTLASGEGTSFPLGYPTTVEAAAISPTGPACAPQDHLDPILLAYLRSFPMVDIHFGCELVRLEQSASSVRATVRTRHSGRSRDIDALFVVCADGAHSTGRQQLRVRLEGPDDLADFQRIEFQAPLGEIVGDRRYLLTIITHPDASGVLAPRGPNDRWGFSREVRAGQVGLVDYSDDQIVGLLTTAIGVPGLRLHLERRTAFRFAAQIAERYRDRHVFLAGDAAHRTTPRGGTGMNMGIQDAFDLGWKLGWVLRGWAQPQILDSYESERRPVGLHNVQRSAEPDGARQEASEALSWDLNGCIAHHWLQRGNRTVSTLDLLGGGLTLVANANEPGWADAASMLSTRAPVLTHLLDEPIARSLGLPPQGALLLRPDGRRHVQWPALTTPGLGVPLPGLQCERAVV